MGSSLPSSASLWTPRLFLKSHRPRLVRAQSSADKDKSLDLVDSNLNVLRKRMEQVRMRERLQSGYRSGRGWLYQSGDDNKSKREETFSETLLGTGNLILVTFGLTLVSGALGLCLVSLVLQLSQ